MFSDVFLRFLRLPVVFAGEALEVLPPLRHRDPPPVAPAPLAQPRPHRLQRCGGRGGAVPPHPQQVIAILRDEQNM